MVDQLVTDAPFAPDWVSPPGDTIFDLMEEREWTQAELAKRLGYSRKHTNQLIKGKAALTEDAAIRLSNVLGAPINYWLKRESQYRERAALLEKQQRHTDMSAWLDQFPLRALMDQGVIKKCRIDNKAKPSLVDEMLTFFGVATPEQWEDYYGSMEVCFRRSLAGQTDVGAISAWLRIGEQYAEKLDAPHYNEVRFKTALQKIRTLTCLPPEEFHPQLTDLLNEAGVVFLLVPALPRTRVSGVARWLNAHRPLIQLSLYGKKNDRFWFTFFHEAAHILLHSKEKKSVFLDDLSNSESDSVLEQQADTWARDFLIPPEKAPMLSGIHKTKAAVQEFAEAIGVHPAIVVGRLQYEGIIRMDWMNDLKVSFEMPNR